MATTCIGYMKTLPNPLPSLELLKELFEISKDSPSGLIWKNPKANRLKAGQIAGTKNKKGYWIITITTDKAKKYYAHRIAYYMQTEKDPGKSLVDHVLSLDDNLDVRTATVSQNGANSKKRVEFKGKKTSSTFKGVYWNKIKKKWYSYLSINGKKKHLGCFENEKDAAKSYNKAAIQYFGEFARLNKV